MSERDPSPASRSFPLLILLLAWAPHALAVTYANVATTFGWIDASTHIQVGYNTVPYKFNGGGGCGTTPPTIDDTLSDNIPIGFTFMYGGVNFTQARIMSNGRLQFNNNTTCGYDVAKCYGLTPGIPVPIDSLRNADQIDQWHREKGMLAFSLREPQTGGGVVDVLVRPDVSFERLIANAVTGELFGRRVMIASIDDLLAMKRAANRPKDRIDVVALEKIKRGEDPNV
ncbi:MAG: hypothetical protein Q8O34_11985 [Rhodocyclaceae bacterium]|nr:hypothetical protein [Rhodocyclaceae bacterium]